MSRSVSKEHAEQTDLVIATKFSKYTEIRRSEGFVAARRAAVDDLTACIVWLDAIAGTRATYDLIQGCADNLAEDSLRVDA